MTRNKDFLRLVVDRDVSASPIKGVYLITDHDDRLLERVQDALSGGGVSVLQYRNKIRDNAARTTIGLELKQLCSDCGVTFIVNDDPQLALELDADGVHLGQEDGDPGEARKLLGPRKIIGVSTHSLEEAKKAEAAGANYVGFGAMFSTSSKDIHHQPGPSALAVIKPQLSIPVVAIGGINRDNAVTVLDSGADAIAVISSVLGSREPAVAAAELALLFNRRGEFPRGSVLTIAGSDSGGGAGIQADLKTISLLGCYGASAITAVTAQNTKGVTGIHGIHTEFLGAQIDAVLSDINMDVVKTGMLFSSDNSILVAEKLLEYRKYISVIDPVMIAKGGASLLDREAVASFRSSLLPAAYLLTPNIPEAEKLTGMTITTEEQMEEAARMLCSMGARNVLIKGGHLPDATAVDILHDGSSFTRLPAPRILTRNTHGTGCTLASAIATFLAQGQPLPQAVARGKEFITTAIRFSLPMGKGHGPVNHYLAAEQLRHGTPAPEPG
jgi:hydroxymethylpyrimidine kinase/phosphomethylpyrimidine kinase/thiamine-phosphate diphosphorylase